MQNFHPILYSTPMVQSILKNLKSMTRRTRGLESVNIEPDFYKWLIEYPQMDIPREAIPFDNKYYYAFTGKHNNSTLVVTTCPYGNVGDILWVKEMYYAYGYWKQNGLTKTGKQKWLFVDTTRQDFSYRYFENPPNRLRKNSYRELGWYKRNSLFMPKAACRIFLEITDIKVERLQDISEEDARKEGVYSSTYIGYGYRYADYLKKSEPFNVNQTVLNAYNSFQTLWQKINGKESWDKNPWVWVIEFKRINKPENFK